MVQHFLQWSVTNFWPSSMLNIVSLGRTINLKIRKKDCPIYIPAAVKLFSIKHVSIPCHENTYWNYFTDGMQILDVASIKPETGTFLSFHLEGNDEYITFVPKDCDFLYSFPSASFEDDKWKTERLGKYWQSIGRWNIWHLKSLGRCIATRARNVSRIAPFIQLLSSLHSFSTGEEEREFPIAEFPRITTTLDCTIVDLRCKKYRARWTNNNPNGTSRRANDFFPPFFFLSLRRQVIIRVYSYEYSTD